MVELGDCLRLEVETQRLFRRRQLASPGDLERDDSIELKVARPIDDPHAATTNLAEQLETGDYVRMDSQQI
jgi:hypothetical protein